jgi:small-conductance mechanosensitive channel
MIEPQATNLSGQRSDAVSSRHVLSRVRLISTAGLFLLFILCLALCWTTRDAMTHLPLFKRQVGADTQNTPVDLRPWQTAEALATLAVTAEEAEFAREAERLADHDVDQAFASALRQASTPHRVLTGASLILSGKLAKLQQIVKEDQAHLQSLTRTADLSGSSATHRAAPATVSDDLDVAKAQLGLDTDELADAQQDLARAVGDQRGTIQQELAAHEAAMRKYDAQSANETHASSTSAHQQYRTIARLLNAWVDQRTRYQLIGQAMQQAQSDAMALTAAHNQLEREANTTDPASTATSDQSDGNTASGRASIKTVRLATLANRTAQSQLVGIYDDRIQTEQQLAAVYGKWSAQVSRQHRTVLHLLLWSFALIAFILICVILFDALVVHLVDRPTLERRRMQTLRVIFKLGIRFAGASLILLVVFGPPGQMPTILGLTTAGLTLVLQDFIIAFLGWFVLMGKNGIRVGDWVEINGVGGEIAEIGLFRTAMLETGKGHPTGRRVTFMNSFAIKGQYFNFSTTSQWTWDEITVSVPASDDPYAMIELISQAVLKETEEDARLAEAEWKRVTRQSGWSQFTAGPAVDMRPSASGIDIVVRYVTRASDRSEVRNRLYQCVIGLLHSPVTHRLQPDQSHTPVMA